MIFLHGNLLGFLMFLLSGLIAYIIGSLLKLPASIALLTMGIPLIAMDLAMRWRKRPEVGWLTEKRLGGYLIFIPAWGVGIILVLIDIVNFVQRLGASG